MFPICDFQSPPLRSAAWARALAFFTASQLALSPSTSAASALSLCPRLLIRSHVHRPRELARAAQPASCSQPAALFVHSLARLLVQTEMQPHRSNFYFTVQIFTVQICTRSFHCAAAATASGRARDCSCELIISCSELRLLAAAVARTGVLRMSSITIA